MILTLDFETRSKIDIKKCGAYRYAEDESTQVLMLSVKVDDEPSRLWIPYEFEHLMESEIRDGDLAQLIKDADEFHAHNAGFERVIWKNKMEPAGFEAIPLGRWHDTAAQAACFGIPRDLDSAGRAMNLHILKDGEGHRLMLKMCKPRKPTKHNAAVWHETESDFRRLAEYCRNDTETEYALGQALPPLPKSEREVWLLDQIINDRGIKLDVELCQIIKGYVLAHEEKLTQELQELTGGEVKSAKQVAVLKDWLESECEVETDDLRKETVKNMVEDCTDPKAKRVLEIRQSLSMSSTAKLNAALNAVCKDGRVHGNFVYYGAIATGRFAGRLMQPQNLPRGTIYNERTLDGKIVKVSAVPDAIFEFYYGDPYSLEFDLMGQASSCIRSLLIPGEGLFSCGDYAQIEARVNAWLAGQDDKVQAFRDNIDLYKLAATAIYGVGIDSITKAQRQIGKVAELACVSLDALVITDRGDVPLRDVTTDMKVWDGECFVHHEGLVRRGKRETVGIDGVRLTADHKVNLGGDRWLEAASVATDWVLLETALSAYPAPHSSFLFARLQGTERPECEVGDLVNCGERSRFTLRTEGGNRLVVHNCGYQGAHNAFISMGASYGVYVDEDKAKGIVAAWRQKNDKIVRLWKELMRAAIAAVENPGTVYQYRLIKFGMDRGTLVMRLPSGRFIRYNSPEVEEAQTKWGVRKELTAMCQNSRLGNKWMREPFHGGLLCENLVQAVSRDLLVDAMLRAEKAGMRVVSHVHDEMVVEGGSLEELIALMKVIPAWAEGLPVDADGWTDRRYKKDD